jgi:hypothetical protein
MGVLKRKEEKSETIALRVPESLKTDLEELRKRTDAAGFDLTATITESLIRLSRQVRSELDGSTGRTAFSGRSTRVKGVADGAISNGTAA